MPFNRLTSLQDAAKTLIQIVSSHKDVICKCVSAKDADPLKSSRQGRIKSPQYIPPPPSKEPKPVSSAPGVGPKNGSPGTGPGVGPKNGSPGTGCFGCKAVCEACKKKKNHKVANKSVQ